VAIAGQENIGRAEARPSRARTQFGRGRGGMECARSPSTPAMKVSMFVGGGVLLQSVI
jgi:hypothetical protein